jgi:DNA-binding CsgD family transcriptional regulator
MALTRTDETELLTALHEGPFEQPLWSTFLARLKARAGAGTASLVFRRGDAPINEATELSAGERLPPALRRHYIEELHRHDPLPYRSLRFGRVYALSELLDPHDSAHVAFRETFLAPGGVNDMRLMRITEPGGYQAWLSISRREGRFGAGQGALLAALAPHCAIALRSFATIERERIRAGISSDAIRRLNFGWLTLDAGGRVIEVDPQAERLLQRSGALRTAYGRLSPALPQADRALAEALRAFAAEPEGRARAIHLSDEPWLDMLLVPMRDRAVSGERTPALIAYVHGEDRSSADRRDQLVELFGLSPSEARLAIAISRGRSIAEAAEEIGVTIETARNYSKRIYAKTGVRGQADLVRLILASVVALA